MSSMKKLAATVVLGLGLIGSMAGCRSTDAPQPTCTVEGCVERAGPIEMTSDTTAFQAVMRAGPIEGRSDLGHVQLLRATPEGELSMNLDLARMVQAGDSSFNVLVQPGDVLKVPELKQ
jgi:protein involved in polysaccharide export with SLBB domain